MTEKTLTTENIKPALDALRGELAPWPVVAKKQDRLNTAQLNAANSGITSSLVAQIIANTAAIRALESAITGTGLRALVVATLPAVGTTGILYIVPVTTYDPETDADVVNYSNEYIWIPVEAGQASEGHYEQVGQTGIVINNGQLTITVNGTSVGTFTANQSGDTTAAITVPTNADYVDRTTDQTVAGVKTFSSTINGTASKAIADEDGTSIKTGYVSVAGNQTISGQKTWTAKQEINTGTNTTDIYFNSYHGQEEYNTYGTSNYKNYNCFLRRDSNRFDNSVGIYRSVGILGDTEAGATIHDIDTSFAYYDIHINYKFMQIMQNTQFRNNGTINQVIPSVTNTTDLGTSTNQWKSVYSQTYYYNGTAWGLDKVNEWSNTNYFNRTLFCDFSNLADKAIPNAYIQDPLIIVEGNTSPKTWHGGFALERYTNGDEGFQLLTCSYVNGTTQQLGALRYLVSGDGTESYCYSRGPAKQHLGTSTNKWTTLNGVNPGALSLPSSSYVDIDTTNWDKTGATSQSYTPAVHGWLFVSIQNIAGNYLSIVGGRGAISMDGTGVQAGLRAMLPVIANESVSITVKTGYIFAARFYPMLGNV